MPQLIVNPASDSTMDFYSPDTNYGQSATIAVGVLLAGGDKTSVRHAIANFNVSAIPVAAVITQAKLQRTLTLADTSQHSVRITRCTRPAQWTENGVTWNKYDGFTLWTEDGGDYDDVTPAPVSYIEAVAPGPHEITGLGGFVRDALDLRNGIVSLIFLNTDEDPPVSQRSAWLAAAFWSLVIDYNLTADPGRRSSLTAAQARRPRTPRAPAEGHRPARPSIGREVLRRSCAAGGLKASPT